MNIDELRRRAVDGDAEAQFNLGQMHDGGIGAEQDLREAAVWYRRAAEQGHARAQFNMAGLCHDGAGVARDLTEEIRWLRQAAEQGLAEAQHNLGIRFFTGEGVPRDLEAAAQWYLKAAEQGFPRAQYNYGEMCHFGEGVAKNPMEAAQWYLKAAKQGDAMAQNNLGLMLFMGQGIPKDIPDGIMWLNEAAGQGCEQAAKALQKIHETFAPSREVAFGAASKDELDGVADLFAELAATGDREKLLTACCYFQELSKRNNQLETLIRAFDAVLQNVGNEPFLLMAAADACEGQADKLKGEYFAKHGTRIMSYAQWHVGKGSPSERCIELSEKAAAYLERVLSLSPNMCPDSISQIRNRIERLMS